jgi:hypothetical protein
MTTDLEDNYELESLLNVVDELGYVHTTMKAIADRLTSPDRTSIGAEGMQMYMILRRLQELIDSAQELYKIGRVSKERKQKVPA